MCSYTAEFASLGQSWVLKVELDQLECLCVFSEVFFRWNWTPDFESLLAGAYFCCGGPKCAVSFMNMAIKPWLYVELVLCAAE